MELATHHAHQRHIVLVVGDVTETDVAAVPALLGAGFDAIAVETGSATLALLEGGVEPCVLVLDADVADMDGWELWRCVSARKNQEYGTAILCCRRKFLRFFPRGFEDETYLAWVDTRRHTARDVTRAVVAAPAPALIGHHTPVEFLPLPLTGC